MTDKETYTLVQSLRQLQNEASDDTLDIERVQSVTQVFLTCYQRSADAAAFDDPLEGPAMLAQFAALYADVTLVTLSSLDLEHILFDVIPAKVSAGPTIAKNVVDTTRAFYVWLKREHALEQADDIIVLLNDDATRELEQQMDDPANYSPAKAMMMQAIAQGVDLSSKEAIDAYMLSQIDADAASEYGSLYGDSMDDYAQSAPPQLSPEQKRASQKKRKKNRKAARKARKKNR